MPFLFFRLQIAHLNRTGLSLEEVTLSMMEGKQQTAKRAWVFQIVEELTLEVHV
jgi:hypothetical protein